MLIAAKAIAKKPKILEVLNTLSEFPDYPAMLAPTIITEEIAFVTDIKGVCKDGVTLHTTKYPIKIESIKMLSLNINGSISINLFYYCFGNNFIL